MTKQELAEKLSAYEVLRNLRIGALVQTNTDGLVTVTGFDMRKPVATMPITGKSFHRPYPECVFTLADIWAALVTRDTLSVYCERIWCND